MYFGDTAHVPYGTKSPDTVRRLTLEHVRFLLRRGATCIVVACNTASATALAALRRRTRVPILGVIGPGVREALARTRQGRIGVLGTSTTVASGAYQRALARQGPRGTRVFAAACPLFVPLIEEGWAGARVTGEIARRYLAPLRAARVDTVILGCTHYPILKPALGRVLGPRVALVDSAEAVARALQGLLGERGLLRRPGRTGTERFFLTDVGGSFRRVAARFLGRPIPAPRKVNVRVESLHDGL